MRSIKTWRDPYGEGFSTCRPKMIELQEGLTVLVGCNGAGKSTLLHNIEDELKAQNVPVVTFDNLNHGGSHGIGSAAFNENWGLLSSMMTSSEGETIGLNIGNWMQGIRHFIFEGKYTADSREARLNRAFASLNEDSINDKVAKQAALRDHPERWLLLDAADSGYSVDNVIELKELFMLIKEDAILSNKELYIVISANEYELARGEQCFDVNTGKYVTFKDYEDYRRFVIKSRAKKNKRYEKLYNTDR